MMPISEANVALESKAEIANGKEKYLEVCPARTATAFQRRGDKAGISVDVRLPKLTAPIQKGQTVGEMVVYKNGVETDRVPLLAMQEVERATWFDQLRDLGRNWTKR